MPVPCFQVDAFSDGPFTGNPAAVCLLPREASPEWMQAVAAEMNLSETAFVSPRMASVTAHGADCVETLAWNLRWFTPKVEVDLCGHATLASACAMVASGAASVDQPITFLTASGALRAAGTSEGNQMMIELDFPQCAPVAADVPAGLHAALGVDVDRALANGTDLLVQLPSESQVRALRPDFAKLGRIDAIRGVIVTSQSASSSYDFVSRFFAPAVGIDEDPVTGSAHCCLAPYWANILGRDRLIGYQASTRGGLVEVELQESETGERRVKLRGTGELIFRGELLVDPW